MELSNVQSALASLEERFHQLRVDGERRLQQQETTIAELRQQLAEAIGKNRTAETKLAALESAQTDQHIAHEQEIAGLQNKLKARNEEVDHLRIRCEVLLQQSMRTQALESEVQRLTDYIRQSEQEDQQLYVQLSRSLDDRREQAALSNDLRAQLKHARRSQEKLTTLLHKKQHLFTRLLQP